MIEIDFTEEDLLVVLTALASRESECKVNANWVGVDNAHAHWKAEQQKAHDLIERLSGDFRDMASV